jgi:predicted HTH transcriptional regulator
MTIRELRSLVRKGENDHLEFKKKVDYPEKVIKEITAFANTQGGELLIGVDDNREISGLKYPDEHRFALENAIESFCKPVISFQVEQIPVSENRFVLRYTIDKSERRPHSVRLAPGKDEYFIRVGDKSVKASREVVEIMERQKKGKDIQFYFGDSEKILMNYLEENNFITIDQYALVARLKPYQAARKLILLVLANVLMVVPGEKHDVFGLNKIATEQ